MRAWLHAHGAFWGNARACGPCNCQGSTTIRLHAGFWHGVGSICPSRSCRMILTWLMALQQRWQQAGVLIQQLPEAADSFLVQRHILLWQHRLSASQHLYMLGL